MAIECAFYFDRPRFYRRAAEVLKPGGLLVLADIAFADRARFLARRADLRRAGTRTANRSEWATSSRTRSLVATDKLTRTRAPSTVFHITTTPPRARMSGGA